MVFCRSTDCCHVCVISFSVHFPFAFSLLLFNYFVLMLSIEPTDPDHSWVSLGSNSSRCACCFALFFDFLCIGWARVVTVGPQMFCSSSALGESELMLWALECRAPGPIMYLILGPELLFLYFRIANTSSASRFHCSFLFYLASIPSPRLDQRCYEYNVKGYACSIRRCKTHW